MTGFYFSGNPSARGAYMLRKFVYVGFHPSPGEGAAPCGTALKMIHETYEKKQKNWRNLCNLRTFFFKSGQRRQRKRRGQSRIQNTSNNQKLLRGDWISNSVNQ
jgi:hypothetical protein